MLLIDPWASGATNADGKSGKTGPDSGAAQALCQGAAAATPAQASNNSWQSERFTPFQPGYSVTVCTSFVSGILGSHFRGH